MHHPGKRRARLSLSVPVLSALLAVAGCGQSEPPPPTPDEFEAAKEKREEIIRKEYGPRPAAVPGKKAAR